MDKEKLNQKVQEIRGMALKIKDLSQSTPRQRESKEGLIRYALMQNENLSGQDIDAIAKELVFRNDFFIQIGDKKLTAQELRDDIIETIKNPINQTTNQKWFDEGKDVIENMNDGNISPQDITQRQDFFHDIQNRITELETLLFLYQTNALPNSKEVISRIEERLQKLQKIKTTVQKATKEPEQALKNIQITEADKARAKIYIGVLDHLKEDKKIPDNMKIKLELNEGIDFSYSISEQMYKKQPNASKQQIINRINQLRGRQQTNNEIKEGKNEQRFDINKYKQILEQQKQRA